MFKGIVFVSALALGLAPMASAQLNSTDKTFVTTLAQANTYEIKAAQKAEGMASNSAYKPYAQMIIEDHTQAGKQLDSTVSTADPSMQLPTGVSETQQAHLDALQNAGSSFDTTYRSQMISTHIAAIKLVQNYVAQPDDNAQVKHFAEGLLPALHKHLRNAKKLPKQ